MLQIGGIVVLFACVFGGFIISGGSLGVVLEAARALNDTTKQFVV